MDPRTPVVVAARRTPIATAGRALRDVPVERLAAPVLRAVLDDAGAAPDEVCDVVLGNCFGPGGNPARVSALAAGLGVGVPGLTVDRQCGSGLEAVALVAALARAGHGEVYLAGGVESASTAPWRTARSPGAAEPAMAYERAPFSPAEYGDPEMGESAEVVAREAGVTRERQDAWAVRSHERAVAAQRAGRYAAELVEVAGVIADERPRPGLTTQRLARFPAAFVEGGTVTAGNACGVSDGAAAVAVVADSWRAVHPQPGLALLGSAVAGVEPLRLGLGPVPAVQRLLHRHGLSVDEVGAWEVTEAFAGQVLGCLDALGIDEERVCSDGGAIALGHPWGASGAVLVVRLFSRMVRASGPRYGVATCGVGGGMGVALLVERVP